MHGLSDRLRQARHNLGLTQSELADRTGIPYRTIQDGERGKSTPGGVILAAYGELGIDLNWLLLGKSMSVSKNRPVPKIEGKRFRIRKPKLTPIPYYDPYNFNSLDHSEPQSVISIDPSKLLSFNVDYNLQNQEWASLASTTVINADAPYSKGTLVLFDTKCMPYEGSICVIRKNSTIIVTDTYHIPKNSELLGIVKLNVNSASNPRVC